MGNMTNKYPLVNSPITNLGDLLGLLDPRLILKSDTLVLRVRIGRGFDTLSIVQVCIDGSEIIFETTEVINEESSI